MSQDLSPAAEAFATFLARCDAGDEPDFDAFCAEHTELAPKLKRLHTRWLEINTRLAGSLDPGAGSGPPITLDPADVDRIVSAEGYGANAYIETTKPLVVVTGPGPNSGKMATCLSQVYHEHERGRDGRHPEPCGEPTRAMVGSRADIHRTAAHRRGRDEIPDAEPDREQIDL